MRQPSPRSSSARVLPPQPPTGNPAMLSVVRVVWVLRRPSRQVMVAMANPVLPSVQFPQHPRPSGLPGARAWIGKGESSPPFQPGTHVFPPRLKVTDRSRASDGPWLPTTRYCCARSALWWNVAKWAKGAACRRALRERHSVHRLTARATAAITLAGRAPIQDRTSGVMDSASLISGMNGWRLSACRAW
jgi:hypothetical protein